MLYNAFEGYGFVVVDDTGEDLLDEICRRFNGKWRKKEVCQSKNSAPRLDDSDMVCCAQMNDMERRNTFVRI